MHNKVLYHNYKGPLAEMFFILKIFLLKNMKNMQWSLCYLQRLKYHLILYINKCADP